MGLTNKIQRIKKSCSKGKQKGDTIFTPFNRLFVDTHSELLLITSLIVLLWILITHTI